MSLRKTLEGLQETVTGLLKKDAQGAAENNPDAEAGKDLPDDSMQIDIGMVVAEVQFDPMALQSVKSKDDIIQEQAEDIARLSALIDELNANIVLKDMRMLVQDQRDEQLFQSNVELQERNDELTQQIEGQRNEHLAKQQELIDESEALRQEIMALHAKNKECTEVVVHMEAQLQRLRDNEKNLQALNSKLRSESKVQKELRDEEIQKLSIFDEISDYKKKLIVENEALQKDLAAAKLQVEKLEAMLASRVADIGAAASTPRHTAETSAEVVLDFTPVKLENVMFGAAETPRKDQEDSWSTVDVDEIQNDREEIEEEEEEEVIKNIVQKDHPILGKFKSFEVKFKRQFHCKIMDDDCLHVAAFVDELEKNLAYFPVKAGSNSSKIRKIIMERISRAKKEGQDFCEVVIPLSLYN